MSEKSLAQYLKELRKSYNYSQEFVASQLYITRQTYSHYETGRITPPVNSLYNLSKLYSIPMENFLELTTTYNHNQNLESNDSIKAILSENDLNEFLEHINAPENIKKFKSLERQEKLFLYYYQLLDSRDQEDILAFMRVKCHNRLCNNQKKSITNAKSLP